MAGLDFVLFEHTSLAETLPKKVDRPYCSLKSRDLEPLRSSVIHTLCHHIILSTSAATADLSASLHNWGAVGIKDVTLREMRKRYLRPPRADQRNWREWEPQTGSNRRSPSEPPEPAARDTCTWLMPALQTKEETDLLVAVKGRGQFLSRLWHFGKWIEIQTTGWEASIIDYWKSIHWVMNKGPLLTNHHKNSTLAGSLFLLPTAQRKICGPLTRWTDRYSKNPRGQQRK